MRNTTYTLLFLSMLSNSYGVAAADTQNFDLPRNYITLKSGAFFPTGDLDDDDFDDGFNGAVAFGHRFNRYFALEGEAGYFQTDTKDRGTVSSSGLTFTGRAVSDLFSIPLRITALGVLPLAEDRFELFGGVGFGVYITHLDLKLDGNVTGPGGSVSGTVSDDDTDVHVGGHFLAGANYNLSHNLFVGVEGRYQITDEAELFGVDAFDLNGFTVTGNLGFRF